ncbi:MAG: hypothetical protein QM759_06480 [Terricaulis sp.]
MSIDERIPGYSDKELATLRANAERLLTSGTAPQRAEAERLLPLVDAELATRKAKAPPKAPKKAAVKPKKAKAATE